MKFYNLRSNAMHKKRFRCKPTLLGKHFVLVSQNLEYKMPEPLFFILLEGKRGL